MDNVPYIFMTAVISKLNKFPVVSTAEPWKLWVNAAEKVNAKRVRCIVTLYCGADPPNYVIETFSEGTQRFSFEDIDREKTILSGAIQVTDAPGDPDADFPISVSDFFDRVAEFILDKKLWLTVRRPANEAMKAALRESCNERFDYSGLQLNSTWFNLSPDTVELCYHVLRILCDSGRLKEFAFKPRIRTHLEQTNKFAGIIRDVLQQGQIKRLNCPFVGDQILTDALLKWSSRLDPVRYIFTMGHMYDPWPLVALGMLGQPIPCLPVSRNRRDGDGPIYSMVWTPRQPQPEDGDEPKRMFVFLGRHGLLYHLVFNTSFDDHLLMNEVFS